MQIVEIFDTGRAERGREDRRGGNQHGKIEGGKKYFLWGEKRKKENTLSQII